MTATALRPSFNLQRFLDAQLPVFDQVSSELAAGEKRSHWMWFIFPQLHGLGHSATAQYFAISGLDEAIAYLKHPVLGPRLRDCTRLVLAVAGRSASEIFGYPDNLKFHSSLTLFKEAEKTAAGGDDLFQLALQTYFNGQPDDATIRLLDRPPR